MDWADQKKPPRAYVSGPATIRVVENGPVRVAVEVTRETEDSKFVQTISLAAGDAGNRVEFANCHRLENQGSRPQGHLPADRRESHWRLTTGDWERSSAATTTR